MKSGSVGQNYFVFYPHVQFVQGSSRAAIYDLFEKRIIWIREPTISGAIAKLATGQSVLEAAEQAVVDPQQLAGYVAALSQFGLGMTVNERTAVEGYRPGLLRSQAVDMGIYRADGILTVEITGECVYDCPWCTSQNPFTSACCSCGRWHDQGPKLPIERLLSAVEHLSHIGVNKLVVRGGEPLLEPERLWTLVSAAISLGMRCEIHSTGTLIDDRILKQIQVLPVHFVFLIPTHELGPFDRATGVPGARHRLCDALKAIQSAGSSFSAKIPALLDNPEGSEKTAAWAQGLGARSIEYLFYLPRSGGSVAALRRGLGPQTPTDMGVNLGQFIRNCQCHYCFDHAYFIAADGRVTPCIGQRAPLAQLADTDMARLLRDAVFAPLEHTARQDIVVCRACEFRFCCMACAVRTEQFMGSMKERHWNCPYTPETGKWG